MDTPQDIDAIANADPNFGAARTTSGMEHSGADIGVDPEFTQPPASGLDQDFQRPSIIPDEGFDSGFDQFPLPDELTSTLRQPATPQPDTGLYELLEQLPWTIAQSLYYSIEAIHAMEGVGAPADKIKALTLLSHANTFYMLASKQYDRKNRVWMFLAAPEGYLLKGTEVTGCFSREGWEDRERQLAIRQSFMRAYECVDVLLNAQRNLMFDCMLSLTAIRHVDFLSYGSWIERVFNELYESVAKPATEQPIP